MTDSPQQALPGMDVPAQQFIDETHAEERAIFEQLLANEEWGADYLTILDEGWYWRDAAYIAWKSLPKKLRKPETYGEFCDAVGISVRGMSERRKRKGLDVRAAKGVVARQLYDHIDDVMDALVTSASSSNYKAHADRRVFLEMVGAYVPKQAIDLSAKTDTADLEDQSEEELARMAQLGEGDT